MVLFKFAVKITIVISQEKAYNCSYIFWPWATCVCVGSFCCSFFLKWRLELFLMFSSDAATLWLRSKREKQSQVYGSVNVCAEWPHRCTWSFGNSFIHSIYFYSTSSCPLLLRGAPDYSIDTISELTCRSATSNCEWRTCPRSLRGVGFERATFRMQGTELTTERNDP